jgi:glycosyltransferase involved in cell wall biosynthesis
VRVVVYPHMMEIGGSQLNAIELAGAVRDLGHDVVVFAQPGPLAARVAELGLELVPAPRPGLRPSPRVMRALGQLVRARSIDVVHGYEWTTAMEAYWGPRAWLGVPAVCTVMSMAVAPFLPRDMPLIVGTEQIAAHERAAGRAAVEVIEPPVDVRHNAPGAADGAEFRRRHELDRDAFTVVCVTRLAAELKLEGLLTAIDAVAELALDGPAQLAIVGDGPTRAQIAARAAEANARAGRRVVVLTGELHDPRGAYAAADVCLGMGGSSLRAMAFARPVVVQGERGFWELVTPDSVPGFLWTGWYGVGDGPEHGRAKLAGLLRELRDDGERAAGLGAYARGLVEERFALQIAAPRQLELYHRAIADAPTSPRQWLVPGGASASKLVAYELKRRVAGLLGRGSLDDMNAQPVAAASSLEAPAVQR